MKLHLSGLSHHRSSVATRERLAFSPAQAENALDALRRKFPAAEAVLLSTCNRVEIYTATDGGDDRPSHDDIVAFLADFHGLSAGEIFNDLYERSGEEAVRHLFTVAAGLDSMVLGEPQILAQVKQAYDLARTHDSTGPITHAVFQWALKSAKRVASETQLARKRVSIPSVAVADFAKQIFERFDDKQVLVIGAGEMGEETLRYLKDEGAQHVTVINRHHERARELALAWAGQARPWEDLQYCLVEADVVVSTTGASRPIVTWNDYRAIEAQRFQRPLFVLDLAIPRDFDPIIGEQGLGVYLYSIDDLRTVCDRNLQERKQEMPRAMEIVEREAADFMADLNRRATGVIIQRLKQGWREPMEDELRRLFNKLPQLGERDRGEIVYAFERLVNKLLHPPLESLRDEAREGTHHGLIEALKRLFGLRD